MDGDKNTDKVSEGTPDENESKPDTGTSPEQDTPTAFYKSKAEEAESRAKGLEKELEQARYTLAQKRIENKDKSPEAPIDPAVIVQQVREQLAQEQVQAFRESLSSRIEDKEELAQVEYFLDNVIKSTGNPENDLILALSLANSQKYQAQTREMSRALATKGKTPDLSSNKVDGNAEVRLSDADKAFIALADSKKKNV